MRCLAACHTELVVRLLDAVLSPGYELDVLVESPALAARFHNASFGVTVGDAKRVDTYVRADLTPGTCVIIEDNGRRSLRKVIQAIRAAGGTLIWVLGTTPEDAERADALKAAFPEVNSLTLAELTGPPLQLELGRSVDRQRVQQYQRYLSDADRILIMLHNDPDPDAIASGLALRNILRRTRQTAIIGCMLGVSRPGEPAHAEAARSADRGADRGADQELRSHRAGGRAAALLPGPAAARRSGHRSSPGASGLQRRVQGHPARLRVDVDDSDRAHARRGYRHL